MGEEKKVDENCPNCKSCSFSKVIKIWKCGLTNEELTSIDLDEATPKNCPLENPVELSK